MSVDYSRVHRFEGCHVKVTGETRGTLPPQIRVSAGAHLTLEEALELAESILAARRTLEGTQSAGRGA